MSPNRKPAFSIRIRPALLAGAGLLVFGPPASSIAVEKDGPPSVRRLPEITFFWEEPGFREGDHPFHPFFSPKKVGEPEEFRIPELPAPTGKRIEFDAIAEPALATHPERKRVEFHETYLHPLEHFLLPADGSTGLPDESSLTLRDALYHAFATNPSIIVRDLQTQIEADRIAQAEAMFVPTFDISGEWSQSRFPQNAAEAAANNLFPAAGEPRTFFSRNEVLRTALKGNTPNATEYELYSNLTVNETTLTRNSPAAIFEEEYTTNLGIRLTQPLGRGFGDGVREAPVRIARINREIAAAELRTELTALGLDTLDAYFQWIEAFEIYDLTSWEQATYRKLAEIIRRRVETGNAGPRDLIRMDIRLARADDRMLEAEQRLSQARHRLFGNFGESFPFDEYVGARPVGEMSPVVPEFDFDESAQRAATESAEIERYRRELEREREELLVARDEAEPTFNLIGGVEVRGLGDDPFDSYRYGAENERLGFNLGLVYSRPIDNRGAEARVREARTTIRQTEFKIAETERSLRHRIQGEIDRLRLLEDQLANNTRLLRHIGDEIRTENLLLETGETSLSSLLEFYEDLFHARSRIVTLLREINVAKARVWAADDSLLERLGIEYRDSSTIYAPPEPPPRRSRYLTPVLE